ncbi:unnamed protein product, partial [Lampetra planeri]
DILTPTVTATTNLQNKRGLGSPSTPPSPLCPCFIIEGPWRDPSTHANSLQGLHSE